MSAIELRDEIKLLLRTAYGSDCELFGITVLHECSDALDRSIAPTGNWFHGFVHQPFGRPRLHYSGCSVRAVMAQFEERFGGLLMARNESKKKRGVSHAAN